MTIAGRRLELRLSVREVADRLGVPPLKLESWEAGESVPYRKYREALAVVLGWTEDQVCAGIPGYLAMIETRTVQIVTARNLRRPPDGPGSEKACPWVGDEVAWRAFDPASPALCPNCGAECDPSPTLGSVPPAKGGEL